MGTIVESLRIILLNTKQQLIKVIAVFGWLVCIASAETQGCGQAVSTTPVPAPDSKEIKQVVETPPKPPEPRFKIYGWIEGGTTGNPDSPIDNHNFGHLYTDRANEPLLNQVSIAGERALDPNATGFDWGIQGLVHVRKRCAVYQVDGLSRSGD